jgi:hypothetical protein
VAHVRNGLMLVRDYNDFGVLDLKSGETRWMEKVSIPSGLMSRQVEYLLDGIQSTSPREVFEEIAGERRSVSV